MYSAIEIARFIITYCTTKETPVSNLQLQKILYFLQVAYVKRGFPLFREEIYAWQHGPVVPEVYYMFSGYGASKIQSIYTTEIDQETQSYIIPIIEHFRQINPWNLVEMTHAPNGPWDIVYNRKIDPQGVIDKRLLAEDITNLGV